MSQALASQSATVQGGVENIPTQVPPKVQADFEPHSRGLVYKGPRRNHGCVFDTVKSLTPQMAAGEKQ